MSQPESVYDRNEVKKAVKDAGMEFVAVYDEKLIMSRMRIPNVFIL